MKLKLFFLTFCLLFVFAFVKAQSNFRRYSIGIHAGPTIDNTDFRYDNPKGANNPTAKYNFLINKSIQAGALFDYNITPYVAVGLHYNNVHLKNGVDSYNRQFKSSFSVFEIKGTFVVAQLFKYNVDPWLETFKNFYVCTGIGYLSGKNNVKDFDPTMFNPSLGIYNPPGYRQHKDDLGKSVFNGFTAPVEIGYQVSFYDDYDEIRGTLSLSYRTNFTTTDHINGFADNINAGLQNLKKDTYSSINLTYKYHFGPFGTYFKPVRSYY